MSIENLKIQFDSKIVISEFHKEFIQGWTVIRFWGEDIKKYTDECVKTVEEAIFDVIICDNDEG